LTNQNVPLTAATLHYTFLKRYTIADFLGIFQKLPSSLISLTCLANDSNLIRWRCASLPTFHFLNFA